MGTLIFPSNTAGISVTPNPQEIYVDANVGDDTTGTGSVAAPYKTIQYALTFCTDPTKSYSLILGNAVYTGANTTIPANVNIEGNGAELQFNLTLGSVGLAGTDQAPFYVTCRFQEFTFDLSPFLVCLPTFDNCSIDKLTRLDATVGPFLVRFSDGSCNDFSIVGNVAFDNTLFLSTGTVETGGSAFIKNTVVGITIDIDAGGTLVLLAGVFVGPTGILNALDPSAIINIDSSSASGFGGTIVGTTNINYLDNAQTIKYIPTTPANWSTVPDTVQEGLDYLASSVIFIYNSGRIFTQTSDSAIVTNTTTETSIVGTGEGSLSVPADGFSVGDSYQVNIAGHLNSRNNDQLTLRVKTAGGIVFTTFTVIMPTCTNQHFDLKINFTIRQIGGAGVSSVATTTLFTFTKDANNTFEGENVSTINNTTFDTTIPNTLEVTAEWNVADPLNSIYTEIFTLFKTY